MNNGQLIPESSPRTWSAAWSALLWFIVGFLILTLSQLAAGAFLADPLTPRKISGVLNDGDVLSLSFAIALPALLAVMLPTIRYWQGQPVMAWLGIKAVSPRQLFSWLGYMLILLIAYLIVERLTDRPQVPEWMHLTWNSVDHPIAFVFVLCVLGPAFEEILYRGHILKSLEQSRLGVVWGSAISSAVWALTHFQYEAFEAGWIFLFGILLCASRLLTGSLVTAFVLHVVWNLISTAGILWQLG